MRIRSVARVVGAAVVIAGLASCSGTGSQFAPQQAPTVRDASGISSLALAGRGIPELALLNVPRVPVTAGCDLRQHPLGCRNVYVTAYSSGPIACYDNTDKSGTLFGSQATGIVNPEGETATWGAPDQQRLIVANSGAQNILEFEGKCAHRVTRTMNVGFGFPVGVAVARDGNIYASVLVPSPPGDYVNKYTPTDNDGVKIGDPNMQYLFFVAVKADDSEICVDGVNYSTIAAVDCTTDGGKTWTNTGIVLGLPGGITFDKFGNLIVDDQDAAISGGGVTIPCPGTDCKNIAFDQDDKHLLVADALKNMVYQIDWPSGILDFAEKVNGTSVISAQPIPRD